MTNFLKKGLKELDSEILLTNMLYEVLNPQESKKKNEKNNNSKKK